MSTLNTPSKPFDPGQPQVFSGQRGRMVRRASLVAPLLLVAAGIVLLLVQFGRVSAAALAQWYAHWWPLLLIAVGVVLLVEWTWDRNRSLDGQVTARPVLGGLGTLLVVAIVLGGLTTMAVTRGAAWTRDHVDPDLHIGGWDQIFGHSVEETSTLSTPILPEGHLVVLNPRGAIQVTGSSPDNAVHITANRRARGWDDRQARERLTAVVPVLSGAESDRSLSVPDTDGGSADLEISVPHGVRLDLQGKAGEVTVREIHADVVVASGSGGADLAAITGRVAVTGSADHGSLSAHSITGDLTLDGRGDDVTISDLRGALNLRGSFFGATELDRIDGPLHFNTRRTDVEIARIDGSLRIESGSGLTGLRLAGPVAITTRNRNIALEGVDGPIEIHNRDGSVKVDTVGAVAGIRIENRSGDVELGLPEDARATVSLTAKNGQVRNDFGLRGSGTEDNTTLTGELHGGGAPVTITLKDAEIKLRRTAAQPWAAPSHEDSAPIRLAK